MTIDYDDYVTAGPLDYAPDIVEGAVCEVCGGVEEVAYTSTVTGYAGGKRLVCMDCIRRRDDD